ncbi:hypothetical protein ACIGW8_30955 [Streptomyces sioyaensis]|uniref:hypothetical protein n=1 Tax=Streptomyces sioyaensis TaxID=67364 RepID=UPI0037D4DE75
MTTAHDRRCDVARVIVGWTRAAVITLVAALAVLVHHEMGPTATTHVPSVQIVEAVGMAGVAGTGHGRMVPMSAHACGPAPSSPAAAPAAASEGGTCSGMAMQLCSTASVDTTKLMPPSRPAIGCDPARCRRIAAGREVPGTVSRAPPDLSLLSRLLV